MKKYSFSTARFVAAAFDKSSFPAMTSADGKPMPEIAIVGRSNVGKSSLINHLLKDSSLAKTSSTPGKTKSINFFSIDDKLAFVDLPGYGYAKVPKQVRESWSEMIDHYLENRSTLRLILCLIDSRRDPTPEDRALVQWAAFNQKPLLLIFTKSDKLTESEVRKNTLASLNALNHCVHSAPVHFVNYSIKDTGARLELIDKINVLLKDYGTHQ